MLDAAIDFSPVVVLKKIHKNGNAYNRWISNMFLKPEIASFTVSHVETVLYNMT